jgi:hypothetical protein
MSLRDLILQAKDLKNAVVSVSEWNNGEPLSVTVRELSAGERESILGMHVELSEQGKATDAVCATIEMAALDENGERLFQPGDAELLAQKNEEPLMRLYSKIMELSGIGGGEESEAGKPSDESQNSGITTG